MSTPGKVELPCILGFEVEDESSSSGARFESLLPPAYYCVSGSESLLGVLKQLREGQGASPDLSAVQNAYDVACKAAKRKAREITKDLQDLSDKYDCRVRDRHQGMEWKLGRRPDLEYLPQLRLQELQSQLQQVFSATSVAALSNEPDFQGDEVRFQFDGQQSISTALNSSQQDKPFVFAVLEKSSPATGFYQQLNVKDKAELSRWLEHAQPKWLDGRLAYLGVILYTDAQLQQVQELLRPTEPPVQPLLTLAITLEWGTAREQLDIPVSLVMRMRSATSRSYEVSNLEVLIGSSDSNKSTVGDLLYIIRKELRQSGITATADHPMQLAKLILQQDDQDIGQQPVQELQELIESATLANLLYRGKQEAAEAAFTSEEMESRVWLAVIRVPVTHPSQVADTAVSQSDAMQKIVLQQSLPEAPGYRLPLVNNNQSAVANELILRVLLMEGFLKDASHDGYKLGLEQLRSKYPKGMDFIVFTPVYLTLRQQTLQRLQDAGLKNSDGTEPRVLSYKFSADTLKQFTAFKAEVMNPVNKNKLFVMIVDEAHQATVRRGAHDAFVNDLMWKTSAGSTAKHGPFPKAALQPSEQPGGLCDQPNLLTLLVSATPACLLTADSRIPRRYYVPKGSESTPLAQSLGLQPYSIIRTNDQRIGHGGMAKLRDMSWIWLKDGGQQSLDATTLQSLVERKVVRELNVVEWHDAEVVPVPYHSINDYIGSTCKPCYDHHGIFSDSDFDQKLTAIRRARVFQTSISNDVALALDYVLSMQYFRIFRYTSSSQSHLVDFAVSRKRLAGDKHIDDYLGGLLGAASCFSPAEKQALHAMLRLPLQLAMDVGGDAEQSWLQSVYEQVQSEYNLSAWCGRLSANAGGEFWTASDQHILKAWLYAKLDSEETRAAVGHQSLDRLRQFSETDRLVKSLVATAVCTPAETCAPLPTSDNVQCAVKGPLIVLRVRASKASDSMGTKVVSVLKRYLEYTQSQQTQWQHTEANGSQYPWQLFEVIGDFGKNDQTEVMQKLSDLAKHRPMSPDHPERNADDFKSYWIKQGQAPSLHMYSQYKKMLDKARQHAEGTSTGKAARKAASLQYSDLHGVPAILVLCEKGRMGDTFPQTFSCQDQRLRSGAKYVTWVQELGRLCRYPSVVSNDQMRTVKPFEPCSNLGFKLLASALAYAHGKEILVDDKDKVAAWESIVGAKAAAQHQAVCNLIWTLNQTARKLHTTPTAGEAREAQEVQDLADTVVGLQGSYAQPGLQIADIRSKLGAPWTADLLEDIVHKIRTWRQGILDHCSTGQTSREAEVFEGAPFGLPVRVLVNGMFRADCLDSNDLVKLFCCCTAEDVVLQPDSVISIARYVHHLPYALVDARTHDKLQQVQQATQQKQEGEGGKALGKPLTALSDNVLENWPVGSQVDKFMLYGKQALRGTAVHAYRDEARAGNKHYDAGLKHEGHIQSNRILLKAQPQQGKTGAYIGFLQHLRTILQPTDVWQPRPGKSGFSRGLTADQRWYAAAEGGSLRWQHPFFGDLASPTWRPYNALKPGKYAHQVALRRMLLLASVASNQEWIRVYKGLMMGVQGENVVVLKGRMALDKMEKDLQPYAQTPPVTAAASTSQTIVLTMDKEAFVLAVNWDGRVKDAASALAQGDSAMQDAFGSDISLLGDGGQSQMRVQISGSIKQQLEGAVHSSIDSPLMNVVQQQLWPAHTSDCPDGSISEALTDICDEPGSWSASMSADASNGVCLNGNVAHTMQVGRILRPVPAGGSQPSKLEAKVPRFTLSSEVQTHLFPELQSFPLPSVHGPVFLATAEAWKTLQSSSSHPVNLHGSDKFSVQQSKSPFAGHKEGQPEQIHSWIFVPSYHRSQDSDPHQMRIDWADAVSHNSQYVRIVVVRAETQEVQDYSQLLLDHQLQTDSHIGGKQATLLMVMPKVIDLNWLQSSALKPHQRQRQSQDTGIGYARLCTQLVAHLLGLESIWMLDDNVSDCWQLPYDDFVNSAGQGHGELQPIKFDKAMRLIEERIMQGSSSHFSDGSNIEEAVKGTACASRQGLSRVSPRKLCQDGLKTKGTVKVTHLRDFTGWFANCGAIGLSLHIKQAYEVGFQGKRAPWGVTPSVYSMMLVNVNSTVTEGALYPAKPYHEDVDFAHLCEERHLVMVKCNWLFFHKARVSPSYIRKVRMGRQAAQAQASVFTVLKFSADLHVGQLVDIMVPASAGMPQSLSNGNSQCSLNGAVERAHFQYNTAASAVRYVVCLPPLPKAHEERLLTLACKAGDAVKTLTTECTFRLIGLQPCHTAHTGDVGGPHMGGMYVPSETMLLRSCKTQLSLVMNHIDDMLLGDKLKLVNSSAPDDGMASAFQPVDRVESILAEHPGHAHLPLIFLQQGHQQKFFVATLGHGLDSALPTLTGLRHHHLGLQSAGPHFLILANIRREGLSDVQPSSIMRHAVSPGVWQSFQDCGFTVTHVLRTIGFFSPSDRISYASSKKSDIKCHVLIVLEVPDQPRKPGVKQQQASTAIDLTEEPSQKKTERSEPSSTTKVRDTKTAQEGKGKATAGRPSKMPKHTRSELEPGLKVGSGIKATATDTSGSSSAVAAGTSRPDSQQRHQEARVMPQQQRDQPGSSVVQAAGEQLAQPRKDKATLSSIKAGGRGGRVDAGNQGVMAAWKAQEIAKAQVRHQQSESKQAAKRKLDSPSAGPAATVNDSSQQQPKKAKVAQQQQQLENESSSSAACASGPQLAEPVARSALPAGAGKGIEQQLAALKKAEDEVHRAQPKKPRDAYNLFSGEIHKQYSVENGMRIDFKDMARVVSETWRTLTAREKAPYEADARKESAQYEQDRRKYEEKHKVWADLHHKAKASGLIKVENGAVPAPSSSLKAVAPEAAAVVDDKDGTSPKSAAKPVTEKLHMTFPEVVQRVLQTAQQPLTAVEILDSITNADTHSWPAVACHQKQLQLAHPGEQPGPYSQQWKSKVSNAISSAIRGANLYSFGSTGGRHPKYYLQSIESTQQM